MRFSTAQAETPVLDIREKKRQIEIRQPLLKWAITKVNDRGVELDI